MPLLTIFQSYHSAGFTFPCVSWLPHTSTPRNWLLFHHLSYYIKYQNTRKVVYHKELCPSRTGDKTKIIYKPLVFYDKADWISFSSPFLYQTIHSLSLYFSSFLHLNKSSELSPLKERFKSWYVICLYYCALNLVQQRHNLDQMVCLPYECIEGLVWNSCN